MQILESKKIAEMVEQEILNELSQFSQKLSLHIVQVGDSGCCSRYVKVKQKLGSLLGINVVAHQFDEISDEELMKVITTLNCSDQCNGIIVQLPLPTTNDQVKIIQTIDPLKDVDSLRGGFCYQKESLLSPVVRGVEATLKFYNLSLNQKTVLLIGKGLSAGFPLMCWLMNQPITLIVCDKNEKDFSRFFSQSDFIVSAVGKRNFIDAKKLTKRNYFFDVGTSIYEGHICGDLDCRNMNQADFCAYTPTPGGIGRLTAIFLMKNLVELSKIALSRKVN